MKAEDIKTVAVIGAGDMGHGIAELAAMAGHRVNLCDIERAFVERGIAKIKDSLAKQVQKQKMGREEVDRIMGSITGLTDLEGAVASAEFAIEAAVEVMDIKRSIFRRMDGAAPADAILASNTSTMSITKMGEATQRGDRVCVVHFFNPPAMMALVEVIRGGETSDATMETACGLVGGWKNFRGGMVVVRVEKDTPGFIFNRMNAPSSMYLSWLMEKGIVDPEGVDATARALGAPMGPFETMDYSGLDISYQGARYYASTLSMEFAPREWLKWKIEAGELGKKTGKGIFAWRGGNRPAIDLRKTEPNFDPMDTVAIQVNEGTKLLEQGVATSASQIDLAMVSGSGRPAGPFSLGMKMGWENVAARCSAIAEKTGIKWFEPTAMLRKGEITL